MKNEKKTTLTNNEQELIDIIRNSNDANKALIIAAEIIAFFASEKGGQKK